MEKRKVLVVDDEICIREVLQRFLFNKGYEVITAANGDEAILKFQSEKPILVILDIIMPGIGGTEVLQKMKDINPAVKIIILTGVVDNEIGKFILRKGAADFMTKPIDFDYMEKNLLVQCALGQ